MLLCGCVLPVLSRQPRRLRHQPRRVALLLLAAARAACYPHRALGAGSARRWRNLHRRAGRAAGRGVAWLQCASGWSPSCNSVPSNKPGSMRLVPNCGPVLWPCASCRKSNALRRARRSALTCARPSAPCCRPASAANTSSCWLRPSRVALSRQRHLSASLLLRGRHRQQAKKR